MSWRPTPKSRRVQALRIDGETIDYKDLKRGDVFRVVAFDGTFVHPIDLEPDETTWAFVDSQPERNTTTRNVGYQVPIYFGTLDEMKKRLI